MRVGLIIIGDEILSGRRRDAHFAHAIEMLRARGLTVHWCCFIGDEPELIVDTLRSSLQRVDAVFCFGGIGATPDDHTRQCAARAANVPLVRHPAAVREIEARFGEQAYPHRILMADLPEGSTIIPNPYNRIPGFSIGAQHFLPGFPEMAWPMMEWVLDTYYPEQDRPDAAVETVIVVHQVYESQLLDMMNTLLSRFPAVQLSSLPSLKQEHPQIELGLRGTSAEVMQATAWLEAELNKLQVRWERGG